MNEVKTLVNDILDTATYYLEHSEDEYFQRIWSDDDIRRFKERADKIDRREEEDPY